MINYPKEYGEKKIQAMYEKLGESLSQEKIDLLNEYFEAVNNFYNIIPLNKVFRIINKQNEEQYSEDDFLAFAEIARHERRYYSILGMEELYESEPESKPMDREIISEYLLQYDDDYDEMAAAKRGKPYYIPPKEELLKYADEYYFERNPYYTALESFVIENIEQDKEKIEDVMQCFLFSIKQKNSDPYEALDFAQMTHPNAHISKEKYKEFILLYINLHNNTRNPFNNGFTPSETYAKTDDHDKSLYLTASLCSDDVPNNPGLKYILSQNRKRGKIGRNDPCPCGSGKKYKKCCGR